jgi:PIN domain nuclease of toxin-antitoxin system
MKLLLDTQIFLWFISGDRRLTDKPRKAISDPENEVFLSVVSLWEAIIKHQLGKLPLPESPEIYLPAQRTKHGFVSLDLDEPAVAQLAKLKPIHRDPFDRILVCQAIQAGLKIVTSDEIIHSYPCDVFDPDA